MADKFTDYYDLLELTPDATDKDVDRAYRNKIQQHHPDKNEGDVEAEEYTKLLNEGRSTLKDPEKRIAFHRQWLVHAFATRTTRAKSPPRQGRTTSGNRRVAKRRPQPTRSPVVWQSPPSPPPHVPPSPATPVSTEHESGLGGLVAAGIVAGIGLLLLSQRNSYDRDVGRYRSSDGKFRSGPWV